MDVTEDMVDQVSRQGFFFNYIKRGHFFIYSKINHDCANEIILIIHHIYR